jgi:leucyl aminopeptidase
MIPTSTNVRVELAEKVSASADAVAVFVPKNGRPAVGKFLDGSADRAALDALTKAKAVSGKAHEVTIQLVAEPRAHRLIVVGTGDEDDGPPVTNLREASAVLAKAARKHRVERVAAVAPSADAETIEAVVTGFLLGSFRYREYKKGKGEEAKEPRETRLTVVVPKADRGARDALERARIIADGQNLARTIASRPGNDINPPSLTKVCRQVADEVGLDFRVLDEAQLAKLGMGGILGVGSGSSTPPRLIVLQHRPGGIKGARADAKAGNAKAPVLIVGKSITFDTGGISIKPADKMGDMVFDKCGGMTVLGLMYVLAKTKYPGHVVGLLTSAENHVSGTAYRPGDILRLYNGVTAEITNTDAEGRLVLADAIAWGVETYKPSAVVDLATLTGGCVVALGHTMAGLMSNSDELAGELLESAETAGEKVWRLPVGDDQRELLKSHRADIVNSAGRWASPLTGAAFLTFALGEDWKKTPWAHFDIAGVADTDKELPLYTKGATGWGVRTLLDWLERRAMHGGRKQRRGAKERRRG